MAEQTITQEQARHILQDDNGRQFFTVTFIKRGDGSERTMNCRKGVSKGVRGGGLRFDPTDKKLVGVFDMAKKQHRFVSLDDIVRINIRGNRYIVKR